MIRAPFDGMIGLRKISPGAYVKPGDDIVALESLGAMKLDFRVPETYLARLAVDQRWRRGWMPIPNKASKAPFTPSNRPWTRKPAPYCCGRLPNPTTICGRVCSPESA